MSWPNIKALKTDVFVQEVKKKSTTMNNIKRRRDSVASVYRRTTKFLSANTPNLLKKVANNKKNQLLNKIIEEQERYQTMRNQTRKSRYFDEVDDDLGERELEYYLGVRKKEICWRDKEGHEQIRKDYLLYHCRISEEEYIVNCKKNVLRPTYIVQLRLKQVPLKMHKKKPKKQNGKEESWCERSKIFKLFTNKRDNESTSSSYSIDSSEDAIRTVDSVQHAEDDGDKLDDDIEFMTEKLDNLFVCDNIEVLLQEVCIFITVRTGVVKNSSPGVYILGLDS